jgi:hypothetical protein
MADKSKDKQARSALVKRIYQYIYPDRVEPEKKKKKKEEEEEDDVAKAQPPVPITGPN